ncbi:MAG: thiolase family protein [Sphingomonadales bacterium]|nr:thiolase family protein [Sphingomonadales bacterium]
MTTYFEKSCVISGAGMSTMYRKPQVYPFNLAVDACRNAIADAGLEIGDIDGIACWPHAAVHVGHGSSAASPVDIKNSLGLKLNWFEAGMGPGQFASIANAIGAIAAGYCNHVLCYRAEGERWVPMYGSAFADGNLPTPEGFNQWTTPYFAPSAATWIALHADLHMRQTGLTREQMAMIPINQRKNAALNPNAVYREPITLDDYLAARMITTPFCIFDCDVPIDGAAAVVISRADAVPASSRPTVRFEAVGTALHEHFSWFQRRDFPNMAMNDAAKMLWSRTDLTPDDLTSAHLYDGFSWLTVLWLEALGITRPGETGAFLEGGQRIALDGLLPLNTNGGQLSEGRLHAFNHLVEAVRQLRGEAGDRQVADAKVAVCSAGGGVFGSALLIVRD